MRASVICDWTTGVHRFREPGRAFEAGKVVKIDRDGVIEWEKQDWHQIRCPSSDTSLRISCDGQKLRFMGNIGRFQHSENVHGVGVVECVERWVEVLGPMGFDLAFFGAVHGQGTAMEWGTTLSRVDLAANWEVSDYAGWCQMLMMRSLGRRHPRMGRYGPQWGYETKNAHWLRAKVYDKAAEQAGERGPRSGATLARLEVQLGREYLRREGLNYVGAWARKNEGMTMAQVIYGRFAAELMRDQASVEEWGDIPQRIRHWAVLWRDGQDVRSMMSRASFYRVRARLLEHGLDIGIPCNVVALSSRRRAVSVVNVCAERAA